MTGKNEVYILGVGAITIVYIELAQLCGYTVKGLYHYKDDMTGKNVHGIPVIGCNDELFAGNISPDHNYLVSVGNNYIRTELANSILQKGGNLPTLIHPSASVSRYSTLSPGTIVHAGAVVQPDVVIENNCVISFNAGVCHTSIIHENCYITPGSVIGARVEVFPYAFIGINATVISGKVKKIGAHAIVGAGSVVTKDVDDKAIVAGNPARHIRYRTDLPGTFS